MVEIKPGFEKQITGNLILKVASTPEEGELIAKFNAEVHGEEFEEYVNRLYSNHPDSKGILWFYILDPELDIIVSSMALLPLTWEISPTSFPVAEMGFVGTLEKYRGQGLFGILNDYYEAAVEERKYVISCLVGIPNFYRKYGYVFALNRYSGYAVPTSNIPQEPIEEVKVRKATEDDLGTIEKLYEQLNDQYVVSTLYEKGKFKFRMMNSTCDLVNSITYIVEEDRKAVGFFTLGSLEDPDQADIILVSDLTYLQMIKVLQFVKTYNLGTILDFNVNVHPSSKFAEYLKSIGANLSNNWPWQIQVPDISRFFDAIKPVLEKRIRTSMFKNLTQKVQISNYSHTIILNFERGKIEDIDIVKGFPDKSIDLRIPNPHYIRLFFSDRDVEEIKHIITDTLVKDGSKLLINTLFPKHPSIPFSFYQ